MGQDQELAILFADVVGSTRLFEVLGDVAARDKVAVCIEIMRRSTEQHGGAVVKTMGDEILATFASCDAAIVSMSSSEHRMSADVGSTKRPRARLIPTFRAR